MLEKPGIPDKAIIACLRAAYGLAFSQVVFLPLGADAHTAVYRAAASDGQAYFVKLRRGAFDELSVALPKFLSGLGISGLIAPLQTGSGQLWADLDPYRVILYPYIPGQDAYTACLTEAQWATFGAALRRIHTAELPAALVDRLQRELWSSRWREGLRQALQRLDADVVDDPVALELATFIRSRQAQIEQLLDRAEQLARLLPQRSLPLVLCHTDLHAGNLLAADDGSLYIVDWDNPLLAPVERDLMFIGGAQGFAGVTAAEEEIRFYRGYGPARIDPDALAYYRAARIIEDLAIYSQELLFSTAGGADRANSLRYFKSNFKPGGTIALASHPGCTSKISESSRPVE